MGGNTLYIKGTGFQQQDVIIVTINYKICELNVNLTNDTNILCVLPPNPEGKYIIKINIAGVDAICNVCDITYSYNYTPILYGIIPNTSCANRTLN